MFGLTGKRNDSTVTINIPSRVVIRVLLLTVGVLILLAAVRQAQHALVLIFTAFFLALALNAPVHWVAQHLPGKKRGNRTWATTISFFLIVAVLGAFLASIVPPLVRQTNTFIHAAPSLISDAKDENSAVGKFIKRYNLENQVQDASNGVSNWVKHAGGNAVSAAGMVTSSVFAVLTILALTFMMLIEGPRWLLVFKDIIPDEHHERAERLARGMYKVVKGYINGQVLLAAIAATLILPMLFILGISYPAALFVVIFICGLIPMVGHTLGAIIVTLVALFTSPWAAIIILGYYFLYQQIENYLIQPRIQANSTNMSPLLVFASVLIGVNFGGLFGGLVAIPVAGCLRIAALDYLRSRNILEVKAAADKAEA
ncbi:MAG TPA: AI-2E family transporter [Candidatus Saccharimonadales bacterium]